jgi:hypothetical protein
MAGEVSQVIEHFPSKLKTLSSNTSSTKKEGEGGKRNKLIYD